METIVNRTYTFGEVLGQGASGTVYRATHKVRQAPSAAAQTGAASATRQTGSSTGAQAPERSGAPHR